MLVGEAQRCSSIELHLVGRGVQLVRGVGIGYLESEPSGGSLLHTVTMTGVAENGSELSAPPMRMGYTTAAAPQLVAVPAVDESAARPLPSARGRVELVDSYCDALADVVEV